MNATRTCQRPMAKYLYTHREEWRETLPMPMRVSCRSLAESQPINWQFVATLAVLGVFVLLLIFAGVEYAATIDALALHGGAGGF